MTIIPQHRTPSVLAADSSDSDILSDDRMVTAPVRSPLVIDACFSGLEREPLFTPFGFKGGAMSELGQMAVRLDGQGKNALGRGTLGTLWSDASVFARFSEDGANSLMYQIGRYALKLVAGKSFSSPLALFDEIFPQAQEYGRFLCQTPDLRKTFVLNALVALDNAAWLLWGRQNGIDRLDDLIPPEFQSFLSERYRRVASIPLISYNVSPDEIKSLAEKGFFFLKIKIGQSGTQEEMLCRDTERIRQIHDLVKNVETPETAIGHPVYYLDANGRYESKETLCRLLDQTRSFGAFDRIVLLEEPFPERCAFEVHDLPIRVAADESAHTVADALHRVELGYDALALKGIAKTFSMTLRIGKAASEKKIPCFCADLTVPPILVEWNKYLAARLDPFPGLTKIGLLESNGAQNYVNWNRMLRESPCGDASWAVAKNGFWNLNDDYFERGGGLFERSLYDDKISVTQEPSHA